MKKIQQLCFGKKTTCSSHFLSIIIDSKEQTLAFLQQNSKSVSNSNSGTWVSKHALYLRQLDDPSTFSIFLYPFGFPRAFVTTSNKATSEIEHRASPWKSRFSVVASTTAKWSTFDVTVVEQWQKGQVKRQYYSKKAYKDYIDDPQSILCKATSFNQIPGSDQYLRIQFSPLKRCIFN